MITCVLARPQGSSCTCYVVLEASRAVLLTCCPVARHAESCCSLRGLRDRFRRFPLLPQPRTLLNQVLLHCGDQRYWCALQRNSLQRIDRRCGCPIDALPVRFCRPR